MAPDVVDDVMERVTQEPERDAPDADDGESVGENDSRQEELLGALAAVSKSYAVAEFQMDGTLLTANENFLHATGYALDEIKGRHHSIFVDEAYRQNPEYREFWAKLNRGETISAEARRLGKGGRELWLQATYALLLDLDRKPFKVFATAVDVTAQRALQQEVKELRVRSAVIKILPGRRALLRRRRDRSGARRKRQAHEIHWRALRHHRRRNRTAGHERLCRRHRFELLLRAIQR